MSSGGWKTADGKNPFVDILMSFPLLFVTDEVKVIFSPTEKVVFFISLTGGGL
jgi:hypothetical protein